MFAAACCGVLQCVLQRVAVCSSVLSHVGGIAYRQACVAVYVAACCGVLRCIEQCVWDRVQVGVCGSVWHCVAAWVAVFCSVLQRVL